MKAWTAPLMTRGYGGLTTVARSRLDSANASAQASVLSSAAATSVSDAPEPPSSASRSTHRSSRPLASSREDGKASYSTAAAGVENGSAGTGVRVPGAKKHSKLPLTREKQALIVMNVRKALPKGVSRGKTGGQYLTPPTRCNKVRPRIMGRFLKHLARGGRTAGSSRIRGG